MALNEVDAQAGAPAHLRKHVSLAGSPKVPVVRAAFHDLVPGVGPVGKLRRRLAHKSLIDERVTEIPQQHRDRHRPMLPDPERVGRAPIGRSVAARLAVEAGAFLDHACA